MKKRMHKIIESLNWRYAVKRFNPNRKLDDETVEVIKESLRLVPTSYGLQAMKFIFVEDPEIRKQLTEAGHNQQQINEASHLLVMCANEDVHPEDIDAHMNNITITRELQQGSLEGYGTFLKNSMASKDPAIKLDWTSKQVYIALGQMLTVCAELRVDAIPMEGFDKTKFDEILGLKERGLRTVLICPLGYRHPEDPTQYQNKVRKSSEQLFETI